MSDSIIKFGDVKVGDLFTIDEQTYEKVGPLAALECKEKGLVIQFTPAFEVVKKEKMMEGPIYKVELELTESEANELYRDLLDRLVNQDNEYPTTLLTAIYHQLCKQRGD